MAVINTNQWKIDVYQEPIHLADKFEPYFPDATSLEIYQYLTMHGMYSRVEDATVFTLFKKKDYWTVIEKEEKILKKIWKGPDVPIFILPSESRNREMNKEFNGKSGIAFRDKLFLFLSDMNSHEEVKSVFTHEYNHVCRLYHYEKSEKNYTLLDSIILEGLAENAVRERFGKKNNARWTSYYNETQLEHMWKTKLFPHHQVKKNDKLHHKLLYGLGFTPKMAGYCVGYYLVKKYLTEHNKKCNQLLSTSSEEIAGIR